MAVHQHNLDSHSLVTCEFAFSEGAVSAADAAQKGYLDFGNLVLGEIQPEDEELEHIGSYRGLRRVDKKVTTRADLKFSLKFDELTSEKWKFALFGDVGANQSQAAIAGVAGTPWDFTVAPSGTVKWYPVLSAAGVQVRRLSDLDITSPALTEGTHFEVDHLEGMVRFLVSQTVSVTPVITCPAISNQFKTITPLTRATRTGIGRLRIYDAYIATSAADVKSSLFGTLRDFGCNITIDGNIPLDGEKWGEMSLMIQITNPVGIWEGRE